MELAIYGLRKLASGLSLLLGVTCISFLLLAYFGPDRSYLAIGKNATPAEIAQRRHELGYDRPALLRYGAYLHDLATLDLGRSDATQERVSRLLARTIPVSLALVTPGFLLGNALGLGLALLAARHRGRWLDRAIMAAAVAGMSVSFVIAIILFQVIFSSSYGLGLFPVRGWDVHSFGDYLRHVTVPTLALVFVTLGYNTRFYRAVLVAELSRDYVRTARAYGASETQIMLRHVLRNALIPIITRILFSVPLVAIGGSLLIESHFGIPGVGRATYEAIVAGDQPVLLAVVALTSALFVLALALADVLYRVADPRVAAR